MREISTLEPTRYEITATHSDGRVFLVSYAGGSPSRMRLLSAMQSRGQQLIAALCVGEKDQISFATKPRPHATLSGWTISYTGRTQRDVRSSKDEKPALPA